MRIFAYIMPRHYGLAFECAAFLAPVAIVVIYSLWRHGWPKVAGPLFPFIATLLAWAAVFAAALWWLA
jgi:hypothetical protein